MQFNANIFSKYNTVSISIIDSYCNVILFKSAACSPEIAVQHINLLGL